ncbi:hypothetical protein [Deinococcus sonorensis]|uniref:Uncharacterized protein n=2 Tax=Deinococcus sonorensis TaxID=309891 RepID=A0AAU7U779_9DEIO
MRAAHFRASYLLLLTGFGLVQVSLAQPDRLDLKARLAALLPLPGQQAQFMDTRSRLLVTLQQRVFEENGDPVVLADKLKQIEQGKVPSYDERLGITRAEFQRYVVIQKTLEPSGRTFRLSVSRDALHLVFGDAQGAGAQAASILKGLVIDLNTGELKTPEGFGARPTTVLVAANEDVTGLGQRSGYTWMLKGSNPTTMNAMDGRLSLLQLRSGQVLLSYSRVSILKGRVSEAAVNILYKR